MEATPKLTTKKKGKKKWIIVIAVIIIIAIIAVLVVPRFINPMGAMGADAMFANAKVEKGTISTTVESSGNIEDNQIDIEIPYGVTVNDILVDEGDYVNDGV